MKQTTFEVRLTEPAKFLEELKADLEADAVVGRIVRLATVEAKVNYRMLGETSAVRADDMAPWDWARAQYVEASYVTTRDQLVKLSNYAGFIWGDLAFHPWHVGDRGDQRRAHNEEARASLSRHLRQVQAGLERMKDLDVRGGGIYVQDGAWTALPGEEIKSPPDELCRFCDEPIYFANKAWRHRSNRRPEYQKEVACAGCRGTGNVTIGGRVQAHATCYGNGKVRKTDHLAAPADVEEEALV